MTDNSPLEVKTEKFGEGRRWITMVAEVVPILSLAALPLLFFWRLITPSFADRAHLTVGDFVAQYYPLRLFVTRELAQGRLPLWNPFLNGGQPALADSQSAVFYPPNLLLAMLTPQGELSVESLERYVIGHFALAAVLTYLFARYVLRRYPARIARLAAVFVAIVFCFSGYLTSFPVQQLTILEAGVWLPALLLMVEVAARRPSRRSVVFWGAMAGLPLTFSWLAGHAQTTMYVFYLAAAYLTLSALLDRPRRWRWVAGGATALVMGTGMAAIQLLPSLEFLRLSTRADLAYRDTSFGLPLLELLGVMLPGIFGGRTLYVGIAAIALAAVAVYGDWRSPKTRFWLAVVVSGLLVSLGGNTFLYSFLYLLLPGFDSVRDQERVVFVVSFALSVLAGIGLAGLLSMSTNDMAKAAAMVRRVALWIGGGLTVLSLLALSARMLVPSDAGPALIGYAERAIFTSVMMVLIAGALFLATKGDLRRGGLAALLLGIALLDLFSVNWQANLEDGVAEGVYTRTKLTEALTALPVRSGEWRISSEGLLPGGGSAASVYQFRDIVGNTPFQLKSFEQANAKLEEIQRSRLLGVRYWLSKRELKDGRFEKLGTFGDNHLYELGPDLRLPRVNLVHDVKVVPPEVALEEVRQADLRKSVVLSQPVPASVSATLAREFDTSQGTTADETAKLIVETPIRMIVEANLAKPGVLVLSDVHYPGWRAFVGGTEKPVVAANYLMRGLALPAGHHIIEWRYEPGSLSLGATVSALLAGLILAMGGFQLGARLLPRRGKTVT